MWSSLSFAPDEGGGATEEPGRDAWNNRPPSFTGQLVRLRWSFSCDDDALGHFLLLYCTAFSVSVAEGKRNERGFGRNVQMAAVTACDRRHGPFFSGTSMKHCLLNLFFNKTCLGTSERNHSKISDVVKVSIYPSLVNHKKTCSVSQIIAVSLAVPHCHSYLRSTAGACAHSVR